MMPQSPREKRCGSVGLDQEDQTEIAFEVITQSEISRPRASRLRAVKWCRKLWVTRTYME